MVEVPGQYVTSPTGEVLSREALLKDLKGLVEEIAALEKAYLRRGKASKGCAQSESPAPPPGYSSFQDYSLACVLDTAFFPGIPHDVTGTPTWRERYFAMVDELRSHSRFGTPIGGCRDRSRWHVIQHYCTGLISSGGNFGYFCSLLDKAAGQPSGSVAKTQPERRGGQLVVPVTNRHDGFFTCPCLPPALKGMVLMCGYFGGYF